MLLFKLCDIFFSNHLSHSLAAEWVCGLFPPQLFVFLKKGVHLSKMSKIRKLLEQQVSIHADLYQQNNQTKLSRKKEEDINRKKKKNIYFISLLRLHSLDHRLCIRVRQNASHWHTCKCDRFISLVELFHLSCPCCCCCWYFSPMPSAVSNDWNTYDCRRTIFSLIFLLLPLLDYTPSIPHICHRHHRHVCVKIFCQV